MGGSPKDASLKDKSLEDTSLKNMGLEELWQLFPIRLEEHNPAWAEWYAEEECLLKGLIPEALRISHIGSTAIEGISAKPIVDILVELPPNTDLRSIASGLENHGYIVMSASDSRTSMNKGYTSKGYADKVFHIHLRHDGDSDELCFRDYLIANPKIARDYEALKLSLAEKYEHNRDAYTDAKGEFVTECMKVAKIFD